MTATSHRRQHSAMKLLFVTGGDECPDCGGSGKIPAGKVWSNVKRGYVEAFLQCGCVEALEATVKRSGTMVACGDPNVKILDGEVLPKPTPANYEIQLKIATGTRCSVCGKPQYTTKHGVTCDDGHGGAPPKED